MATVFDLLPTRAEYFNELQRRGNLAEEYRRPRFIHVMNMIRRVRGNLIRRYVAWLAYNALIIQCAFRRFLARKAFLLALKRGVQNKHAKHYRRAATILQSLWRGYYSRRSQFCYRTYRHWLATIKERGERRAAEAAEFRIRSKADDLKLLEEEARQWLAFVVFKLHHLLRTYVCAGVYSEPATSELSEFEKLLKSIRYREYMKRLRRKYDEFVRKHRPAFSSKRLFPIIGDGADYWYLSLPEMYELTKPPDKIENTRHKALHHGAIHEKPFLWKNLRPAGLESSRGPFSPAKSQNKSPPPPPPSLVYNKRLETTEDPRFNIYVKHYKPDPALFDYVNFHINALLSRKCSIENILKKE